MSQFFIVWRERFDDVVIEDVFMTSESAAKAVIALEEQEATSYRERRQFYPDAFSTTVHRAKP